MDIKKLAAEMELSCINAYKLDALKSVIRSHEKADVGGKNQSIENDEELDVLVTCRESLTSANSDRGTTDECKNESYTETSMTSCFLNVSFFPIVCADHLCEVFVV